MSITIDLAGAMDKITPEVYEIASRHMTDVYIARCEILEGFFTSDMGITAKGVSNDDLLEFLDHSFYDYLKVQGMRNE